MEKINKLLSLKFAPHMIIAAFTLVVFLNTFSNGFVYDDSAFIVENKHIRNLSNIPSFFLSSKPFSARSDFIIYRPIASLTFALDYGIWKLNPFGYHILNMLFHALSGMMVYVVLVLLLKDKLLSLFAALLFVSHPAQTEAVTWIAGRGNAMSLFFFLASFWFFIKYREKEKGKGGKEYTASLLIYAISLLTKEAAIVLPLVIAAYDVYFGPSKDTPRQSRGPNLVMLKSYIPFLVITLLYLILRHFALGRTSQQGYWGGGIIPTALTMAKVFLAYYVRFALLPTDLCVDHNIPVSLSPFEGAVLAGMIAIVLVLFLIVKLYGKNKPVSFGMAWFLIALVPVSNIIPLQALFAERFLYMPLVGFCMIVSVSLLSLRSRFSPRAVFTLAALILLFYSASTVKRNTEWKSDTSLWSGTLRTEERSFKAYTSLGLDYTEKGSYEKAIEAYKKAIEINPNFEVTRNNLANVYQKVDRFEDAVREYEEAIRLQPRYYEAYANMGNAYKKMGKIDEAIANYGKALEINYEYADAHFNLGVTYAETGRYDEAMAEYRKAVQVDPAYAEPHNNMGTLYRSAGKVSEAIRAFRECIRLKPDYAEAHYNLAVTYDASDTDEMIKELYKTIRLKDDFKEAHYNLAIAYERKGMFMDAMNEYAREIQINPSFASSYKNLGILHYRMGEYDKTVSCWKEYLVLNPAAPDRKAIEKEIEKLKKKT